MKIAWSCRWTLPGVLALAASGQTFEVASVKSASGQARPSVKVDAARVDIESLSLADLIRTAYRLKQYELVCPDWVETLKFDVQAKIPEGRSRDQMPEMLQSLLAARFKLVSHRASRELPVYALVVGTNGPKLKKAPPGAAAGAGDGAPRSDFEQTVPPPPAAGPPGAAQPMTTSGPAGSMRQSIGANGMLHLEIGSTTLSHFVDFLTAFVDRPVVDMTDLKESYAVQLDLSMDEMRNMAMSKAGRGMPVTGGADPASGQPADTASEPSGVSIFAAVQKLGLKLEARKAPVQVLVVDRAERSPTGN
jgi:uncharacterized protein (TIGR03435 family)